MDLRTEVGAYFFKRPDLIREPEAEGVLRAYWECGTHKVMSFEDWMESIKREPKT